MRTSETLQIFSQILNFVIFLHFAITLIQIGYLDVAGLLISAVGLIGSLLVSIIAAVERLRE